MNAFTPTPIYRFGPFSLIPSQRLLLEGDQPVRLGSRAMAILIALVEHAGSVLSKDALMAIVWPGVVVDAAALRVHTAALRKVLGDGRQGQRYIATIPQRGYSFVAPVARSATGDEPPGARPVERVERGPHNLPPSSTRLVGRADLIAALAQRMGPHRCITVVGTGGIGKTTLALALAERLLDRYADGARFIDLSSLGEAALVPQALASVLGVAVSLDDPLPGLVAQLGGARMLLVFDNCEHVVDAVASLAEHLLVRLPSVDILATSREALRIRGEWVQRLESLEAPPAPALGAAPLTGAQAMAWPAIQLFAVRCAAAVEGFEIDDGNAALAADICRRLDGIPLAIELAAGRVGEFGLRGLASLLDDRLRPLARGWRNAPPRHQTLRATLDWSFGRLREEERRVLRRVAVFSGSFTFESARAVCGADALESLGGLALKSMLSVDLGGEEVHYRLLETTRAYAMEKLVESTERADTFERHARHCAELAQQMQADWEVSKASQWLGRYAKRLDDLRSAIDWCLAADDRLRLGVQLVVASGTLFRQLSLLSEYQARVEGALAKVVKSTPSDPGGELQLSSTLAHLSMHTTGITPQVCNAFERAYALSHEVDLPLWRAKALGGMWLLRIAQGDYLGAEAFARGHRESGPDAQDRGAAYTQIMGLHLMARHAELRRQAEQVLRAPAVNMRLSHVTLQADTRLAVRTVLGRTLWMQGLPAQALQLAGETVAQALGDNSVMLAVTLAFGACPIALWTGRHDLAQQWTRLLLEHTRRHGLAYMHGWGRGYELLLDPQAEQGALPQRWSDVVQWPTQLDTMRTMHDGFIDPPAVARARDGRSPWNAAEVLRRHGERLLRDGAPDGAAQAQAAFSESLAMARAQQALSWELRSALSLAGLWVSQGRRAEARELLSGVLARFTEGHDTRDPERARTLLRQLGAGRTPGFSKLFNA